MVPADVLGSVDGKPLITVVTGLPRSGTSLAMQLLEAAGLPPFTDGRRVADASNPQGYYEAEIVQTLPRDSSWLGQVEGYAIKVIHLLLPHLPVERIQRVLVMERDLAAVLRSQGVMLERLGRRGAQLPDDRLKAVYSAQVQAMERWLESMPPEAVLRLRYEDCLADPATSALGLLRWLGRPTDPALRQRLEQVVQRF